MSFITRLLNPAGSDPLMCTKCDVIQRYARKHSHIQLVHTHTYAHMHTHTPPQAAALPFKLSPQQLAELLSCQSFCSYATDAGLLLPLVSALWSSLKGPPPQSKQPGGPKPSPGIQPSRKYRAGGSSVGTSKVPPSNSPSHPEQHTWGAPSQGPPPEATRAVCMGLHALCGLQPCLDAATHQAVRTLLEMMAAEAAGGVAGGGESSSSSSSSSRPPFVLPPAVLLALSRCCWVYDCTPPLAFIRGVLQTGGSSKQGGGTQQEQVAIAAAAGLLLPSMDRGVTGTHTGINASTGETQREGGMQAEEGVELVRGLLQHLSSSQAEDLNADATDRQRQLAAVVAFYSAAAVSGCAYSPPLVTALSQAAIETQCPAVLAQALCAVTGGSGGAPHECQVCVCCVCVHVCVGRLVRKLVFVRIVRANLSICCNPCQPLAHNRHHTSWAMQTSDVPCSITSYLHFVSPVQTSQSRNHSHTNSRTHVQGTQHTRCRLSWTA